MSSTEEKLFEARCIIDYFHRTAMHHAIWYAEVLHQFGRDTAMSCLSTAYQQSYDIHLHRLSKVLGFEITDNLPESLSTMDETRLSALKEAAALNWLATDGVWFQAVEAQYGMIEAKRVNDACWAQFSPLEAWSVKKLADMPEKPGLEGLKKALGLRLYAAINKQEIVDETPNSFVFRMCDCRVQSARKRRGLEDYPCKSAGMVEYRAFAQAIDSRITTECIACPPDEHPEGWYCAWRFSVLEGNRV